EAIPGHVFTIGDNAQEVGAASEYTNCYDPYWGAFKDRTRPAPGNHDYHDQAGNPPYYFTYFAARLPAENGGKYYAFDAGTWRLYSLNCEIDCSASSPQVAWLRQDLRTHGAGRHKLAYLHRPRYSCGTHGSSDKPAALWQALLAARADVVASGHDHNYQRYPRMDADGRPSPAGIVSFVAGTGGGDLYRISGSEHEQGCALAQYTDSAVHGVLALTLGARSFSWRFVSTDGRTLDAGTATTLDPAG
ncbi:MAG TPA: metallophosphoesterase, partial [Candidatus Eisenbacteria bacterium]|nr:metallophosphoesterase [Candidatus Eisenbacteria bacterium]